MLKANQENFIKMYFSGLRVQSTMYFMNDSIVEWNNGFNGDTMFIVSPETHHHYLKFIESLEKHKPLLAELR